MLTPIQPPKAADIRRSHSRALCSFSNVLLILEGMFSCLWQGARERRNRFRGWIFLKIVSIPLGSMGKELHFWLSVKRAVGLQHNGQQFNLRESGWVTDLFQCRALDGIPGSSQRVHTRRSFSCSI